MCSLRDAFRVEPLEPRVLLSADPVMGAVQVIMPSDLEQDQFGAYDILAQQDYFDETHPFQTEHALLERQYLPTNYDFPVDKITYDMARLSEGQGYMDSVFVVGANDTLGGSGSINVSILNTGTISPGYSPGIQNVASFTQTVSGILEIEIGGLTAGTQYDQINVTGLAILDGSLAISLIDGYRPTEGATFDIMTFSSVSGRFDSGTGLLFADEGIYFEVTQNTNSLTLIAHELDEFSSSILDAMLGESVNAVGRYLNFDYFQDIDPITFSGSLDLSNGFFLSGDFTLGYDAHESLLNPVDDSIIDVAYWQLGLSNGSGFLAVCRT